MIKYPWGCGIVPVLLTLAAVVAPVCAQSSLPVPEFQTIISGLTCGLYDYTQMTKGADGSVYIAGDDYNSESSACLIKLGPAGDLLWERTIEPAGWVDYQSGITADGAGNVFVPLTDFENERAFVVKYNAEGVKAGSVVISDPGVEEGPVAR